MSGCDDKTVSSELRKLIRKRSSVKSSVTTIINYVNKFNPTIQSCRQIQTRLSRLNELLNTFSQVQDSIVELDQGYEEDIERLVFEDECDTLKANRDSLLAKHPIQEVNGSSHTSNTPAVIENIRLPPIQPPTFSGNLECWASFFDTFNALFHNNVSLNDVQRLHYLKSSVTGPAADIIKNFSITAENYSAAYDELVRHYENKGLTIQSHIRALLRSPKVTTPSASELRQLHHHVASHLRALQALGQPVHSWDAWLVTLICTQLDPVTVGEWQLRQDNKELPTYAELEIFLSKRVSAYEAGIVANAAVQPLCRIKNNNTKKNVLFTRSSDNRSYKCVACAEAHKLYSCSKFNELSIKDRKALVWSSRLCFNCLNPGHQVKDCRLSSCRTCGKKHNTKLHDDISIAPVITENNSEVNVEQTVLYSESVKRATSNDEMVVMLATAIIIIFDESGQPHQCRAVLDSGSQVNFITNSCAQRLGLKACNSTIGFSGIGSMASLSTQLYAAVIKSRFSDERLNVQFHALPSIVSCLPAQTVSCAQLVIPHHISNRLADPQFHVKGSIDILLGSEIFFNVLCSETWTVSKQASVYDTKLGWIVTGKLPIFLHSSVSPGQGDSKSAVSLLTSRSRQRTADEAAAEERFQSSIAQSSAGRYIVRLPLLKDPQLLGDSRNLAQKRFLNLERRLEQNPVIASQYHAFMNEYLSLGHMEVADTDSIGVAYYLPHHAVIKSGSSTTKLRVVFDGSAISSSGLSLNDILQKGPRVQPDLFSILVRFRLHRIALTADVAKMYRQVLVSPEDRDLQRILYRANPQEQLIEYRLCTVTYGTKPASFLATRCLAQCVSDLENNEIKRVVLQDFYVDDLISGGQSEDSLYDVCRQLQSKLNDHGFPLRKWCSNSRKLIGRLPQAQEDPNFVVNLSEQSDTVSTLGLLWQPLTDCFKFLVKDWVPSINMTKRSLLSDINNVYDPIGLICPVLIKGKIFLQQLWSLKLGWDQALSEDLRTRWSKFFSRLKLLASLSIPRRIICDQCALVEIHGFCDASQEAIGACVYLRSMDSDGYVQISLYTAKSRVAPLRPTTIPRLELSGALILADLVYEVKAELKLLSIKLETSDVHYWADSTVVLSWIKSQDLFQAYVANRLARIRDVSLPVQWHHVSTSDNPADLITRGVDVEAIPSCATWWSGPEWLKLPSSYWPASNPPIPEELPELRPVKFVFTGMIRNNVIFERFSTWMKLIRITGWLNRFIQNLKSKISHTEPLSGPLSVSELRTAQLIWLRYAQLEFSEELSALRKGQTVHNKSRLKSLNPFIDKDGLIRVGGRLNRSSLSECRKFPILLPFNHRLTRMLFVYEHQRLLHAGPQALIASIHLRYWPLRSRDLARSVVRKCITCFKCRPNFVAPFMAPLPRERVTIARPFHSCGVDFCGPIHIKSGLRRVTAIKCYVSIFICLSTRAVHLELVTDLTSEAFLAALTRFMSRRGMCAHIHSDNATNFTGANSALKQYFRRGKDNQSVVGNLADLGVQWHFIPPSAPHFGGLWEAAVKSAKRHMLKATKGIMLTYEEMNTLWCRIELILNSRPLTACSSDPGDYEALTPNHFLVGGVATVPQEPDVSSVPQNRLRRFELWQAQLQLFWKRWSTEYLPQLQRRGR